MSTIWWDQILVRASFLLLATVNVLQIIIIIIIVIIIVVVVVVVMMTVVIGVIFCVWEEFHNKAHTICMLYVLYKHNLKVSHRRQICCS